MMICRTCYIFKNNEEFRFANRKRINECKTCYNKKQKEYRHKTGKSKYYGKCRPSKQSFGEISGKFYSTIISRSKIKNYEFNITIEYIWDLFLKQDRKCALSGIELKLSKDKNNKSKTASLDRIDSSKGYIIGNVQWIHKDINWMKNDYNEKYFIKVCKLIANHHGNKEELLEQVRKDPSIILNEYLGKTTKIIMEDKLIGLNYSQRQHFFNQLNLNEGC